MLDDDTYEGTVAVKLGPLRMSYKGKVTVEEVDEANHSARLAASGRDTKGAARPGPASSPASKPPATPTRLHVTSDVQLTGKVASFGRGGAINDVATRLFGQFADCLRATLEAETAGAAGTDGPAATAGTAAASAGPAAASASAGTAASRRPAPLPPRHPKPGRRRPARRRDDPRRRPRRHGSHRNGGARHPQRDPGSPTRDPGARAAEALDAGSLVGTVIKGRLQALFQAVARFFRRLFGRGRSQT